MTYAPPALRRLVEEVAEDADDRRLGSAPPRPRLPPLEHVGDQDPALVVPGSEGPAVRDVYLCGHLCGRLPVGEERDGVLVEVGDRRHPTPGQAPLQGRPAPGDQR